MKFGRYWGKKQLCIPTMLFPDVSVFCLECWLSDEVPHAVQRPAGSPATSGQVGGSACPSLARLPLSRAPKVKSCYWQWHLEIGFFLDESVHPSVFRALLMSAERIWFQVTFLCGIDLQLRLTCVFLCEGTSQPVALRALDSTVLIGWSNSKNHWQKHRNVKKVAVSEPREDPCSQNELNQGERRRVGPSGKRCVGSSATSTENCKAPQTLVLRLQINCTEWAYSQIRNPQITRFNYIM